MMLNDLPVYTVLPAADLARAKSYYQDTLGFKVAEEYGDGVTFESGDGTRFFLYETPNAGTATHTQACWQVTDLEGTMADLRGRGVTFEEYDFPGLKTEGGVAETDDVRGAWFKDSEGNILALAYRK